MKKFNDPLKLSDAAFFILCKIAEEGVLDVQYFAHQKETRGLHHFEHTPPRGTWKNKKVKLKKSLYAVGVSGDFCKSVRDMIKSEVLDFTASYGEIEPRFTPMNPKDRRHKYPGYRFGGLRAGKNFPEWPKIPYRRAVAKRERAAQKRKGAR